MQRTLSLFSTDPGMKPAAACPSIFRLFETGVLALCLAGGIAGAQAQTSVLTSHNGIARTGQNQNETVLTPSNVNANQFGKLFSHPVSEYTLAQPLYVSQVTIPGKGVHNVVYVETDHDLVYAFDADTNSGSNANPLWEESLLTGTLTVSKGIWSTPVIDPSTNTMYLVSSENQGSTPIFRFHALDITSGAEKFGGPLLVQATVSGNGSGSSGGLLSFNAAYEVQRPGLLLLNGVVYAAFGSNGDQGAWHGWIFSFAVNPGTQALQQLSVYCTTPNGIGGGIWGGGAGLAAEVYSQAKPYGRMFVATGNGSYSQTAPINYSMTVLDLDLTGGVITVEDQFTPYNWATLSSHDSDLGSGAPILLPTQTLTSGRTLNPLLQIGKLGEFYILDRDNNNDGSNNAGTEYSPAGLGGMNANGDQVVQEVQTPITSGTNWGAGVWGSTAYWNNNVYSGGTNVANASNAAGAGNSIQAFSFINGVLSSTPTSQSVEKYVYPGPTPSVSANGNTNGIVWAIDDAPQTSGQPQAILLAYDATNLGNTLYSSNTNPARDQAGMAVEFAVPTIANGKVYVGAAGQFNIYGLLNAPTTPTPVISPGSGTYGTPPTVTITDSLAAATIYYTTNGSTPTTNSAVFQSGHPLTTTSNETITAIASAPGYLTSGAASATYSSTVVPGTPAFSLAAGTYNGAQTLTMTDSLAGVVIYYTTDGSGPSTASAIYTQPLPVASSRIVKAIAVSSGQITSPMASAAYTIEPVNTIDFSQGFTLAQGPMQFNGSTDLDDFRLQLTNGGLNEAGTAFYATPVNIQQFSTSFTFQLSNPSADGITFTIQNQGPTALGGIGGGLGYQRISKSVAIKFDLYNSSGEGPNSTGLFVNGAAPTVPAINLTGTGINLHSGDYINATLTYDGATLIMTLVDQLTLASWSQSFTINIPSTVGGNTAYVGFTGATGGLSSSQKLTSWTYLAGPPLPDYAAGFTSGGMTLNGGAVFNGSTLELTDGNLNETRSAFFNVPVNVQQFTSSFDFQLTNANADGFTFTIQGDSPTAVGANGSGGGLGYAGMPYSVALKFDLFNNAGEGADSSGLYIDGVSPTTPDFSLAPAGINLLNGDIFNALLTYDGTTLSMVITDTVTGGWSTQRHTLNIPSLVKGPTAYVGFTAASGTAGAIQQILNWSFAP